ncbi:MAG: D-alanyl-D-alanine carboxypeptidase, partial [Actinomycetota bacterium]|nr:D-alanyl-D-alanine carboxypeptidase [Actinomycetota bacterium]
MTPLRVLACAVAVSLLAGSAVLPGAAAPPRTDLLTRSLRKALVVPHVDPRRTGALAVELSSGRVIFAKNARLALVPASTEKLAVAYAALVTLGPAYRIETHVLGEGRREGATWRGALFLKGHGDPMLTRFGLARLASRLRAAGIRRVTGSIVGDESFFDRRRTAPGWKSWFYVNESPPLSALVVDRARSGGVVSRRPALAAAYAFRAALRRAGIAAPAPVILGRASRRAVLLARLSSRPLARLVRFMGRESDNFTAELLLKQLGASAARRGTTMAGALVVRR